MAGPSRPHKRRKLQAEDDRKPLQGETQESYEVVQKKKYGKVVPDEDDFEEEARGAASIVPVKSKAKGKGRSKERPESEAEVEEDMVPPYKMGPPLGIKKNSITTTKSKPKSGSILRSHSKSETLPPLKLTTKPKKSKPSPNRFRSSPFAAKLPSKVAEQLAQADDHDNEINDDDNMDLGYPEPQNQQQQQQNQHDLLFLPGSDDGYDDAAHHPPAAPQTQNAPSSDALIDYDEIPQPPSRPQPQAQPPSSVGLPAFSGLPGSEPEPEPVQQRGFDLSQEVPETQEMESSDAQPGIEDPKPDNLPHDIQEVSSAESAPSKPGMPSSLTASPESTSESNPVDSTGPVAVTSTSIPVPAIESPQKSKPLHPIPQISPSTFHPHLPPPAPTNDEVVEIPSPPSSIEYFSSPEKGQTRESRRLESIKNWGDSEGASGNSRTETILSSDDALRARGQEFTDNESLERDKATGIFNDFIGGSSGEIEFDSSRMDESIIIKEMEDAYVDLSGYGGQEREEQPPLAQEEEESTQDLERERELLVRQQAGDGTVQQRIMSGWSADQEMDVRLVFFPSLCLYFLYCNIHIDYLIDSKP